MKKLLIIFTLTLPMIVSAQESSIHKYTAINFSKGVYNSVNMELQWEPEKESSIPVTFDLNQKTLQIFKDSTETYTLLSFEKTSTSEHFTHWKIEATNQNGIKVMIHEQMPENNSLEHLILLTFPDYSILYEISTLEVASPSPTLNLW